MNHRLVLPLQKGGRPACVDAQVVGGKGAGLLRLLASGVNIPPGFIVTANCFAEWAAASGAEREFSILVNETKVGSAECADRLAECLAAVAPGNELAREIETWMGSDGWPDGSLAVRSSATIEDGLKHSFAGIFTSVLNVVGFKNVCAAIARVWRSCYSARAIAYWRRFGCCETGPKMAVVVQRMLHPEWAGTLFTCDPLTGSRQSVLVECWAGLGAAVVGGEVLPVRVRVERENGRATVESRNVEADRLLRGEVLEAVLASAREVERSFGEERLDVEWAVENGAVWILQARPITALVPTHNA